MMQLINDDCLKAMDKLIEDGIVVDAIITDPPFNMTACHWDKLIPFDEMWLRLNKLIKPNGAIVLFGSEPFSSLLRVSNLKDYRYDWKYKKKNCANYPNAKNVPLKYIEDVVVFSKAKAGHITQVKNRMVYNPQGLISCSEKIKGDRGATNEISYQRPSNKDYIREFKNYPKNIIEFDYDYNKQVHPTQKPVALMEYLIKTYTNEGELVLDFTCGSGSTLVGCLNTNRRGIGIELDEKYFAIASERINKPKDTLF